MTNENEAMELLNQMIAMTKVISTVVKENLKTQEEFDNMLKELEQETHVESQKNLIKKLSEKPL